jgi:hypothetical protein
MLSYNVNQVPNTGGIIHAILKKSDHAPVLRIKNHYNRLTQLGTNVSEEQVDVWPCSKLLSVLRFYVFEIC